MWNIQFVRGGRCQKGHTIIFNPHGCLSLFLYLEQRFSASLLRLPVLVMFTAIAGASRGILNNVAGT